MKLIKKLESYGIDNVLVRWIKPFLSNRKQRMIGDSSSNWEYVTSSVPKGSVLGPLLFTIFINDLPEKAKNKCKLYADDCKLIGLIEKEEDVQVIQKDLDELQFWAKNWQMSFNFEKCKVIKTLKKKQIQDGSRTRG